MVTSQAAQPEGTFALDLNLDADHLVACVACGMCLPHCPTFRVSGEESASPRGRIALMRQVAEQGYADEHFTEFMDACIQCRGCETSCPAGVEYGELMEGTRAALASQTRYQPWWRRLGYRTLGMPKLLSAASRALAVLQRLRLIPRRLGLPQIPIRQRKLRPSGTDVWLFTGCVMDAWMRDTHAAVKRVVEATGAGVALPAPGAACCGALHVHAGLQDEAKRLAQRVMAAFPGDAPILVDSAGCGAALKAYDTLLQTPAAEAFVERVLDVHEWLAQNLDRLPAAPADSGAPAGSGAPAEPTKVRPDVAVVDPCHLRHVQLAHQPVHEVLRRYTNAIELDDDGLCCGAGGAYSAVHPDTAAAVRDRKLAAVERTGANLVAAANPGCVLHLATAGLNVQHPLEIVDAILTQTHGSDYGGEHGITT